MAQDKIYSLKDLLAKQAEATERREKAKRTAKDVEVLTKRAKKEEHEAADLEAEAAAIEAAIEARLAKAK